ncbi:unnamed protein product [Leptidea sinapis]|uniref:Fibronectin type-III domain-containing protein n=1 Tax=Leptidea sinapis TaxID=189913 RepID=A0A5E4QC22_9NEOP|nr:unnamed protein product [Leptidea sinapis]
MSPNLSACAACLILTATTSVFAKNRVINAVKIDLTAPELVDVTEVDAQGLYVRWRTVAFSRADPVLGYKIKIWEVKESSEHGLELVNAEEYPAEVTSELPTDPFPLADTTPGTREEIATGGETSSAVVSGLRGETVYELRVSAFKAHEDGPWSLPTRIKVMNEVDLGRRASITRTADGCRFSVSSDVEAEHEEYIHVYNSYF